MSIGKSSLARAAAVSAERAVSDNPSVQPMLTAREVAVDSITLPKGMKLPAADEALVKSVRKHGVLEPLTVAQTEDGAVVLLAGARRLAAAKQAGFSAVPAVAVAMAAAKVSEARREMTRFAIAPTVVSATAEQPTAVGQAMPAWLL